MFRKAFLIIALFFSVLPTFAQNFTNRGKLFWVGHSGHIAGTSSGFSLYITTDNAAGANIRISIPGGTYSQNFSIPFNQVTVVTIPSSQTYVNCTDCILNRGVKIESFDNNIVVYAHIWNANRSDATLLIPTETWGKEYFAMSYTQDPVSATQRSQFMVIANEDSTFVDIYPTVAILPSRAANVPYTIMLNAGQIYQGQSNTDVTGTRIVARSANGKSCKSVAAFSGSTFTRLGCVGASTGDNLYKQLFPTTSWGKEFLTAPLKTRSGDQYRAMAKDDSTFVTINGSAPIMINRGKQHTYYSDVPGYITSTKPITLAQYPRSQNCDNVTGDPTMILIPPIEQMVNNVTMYSSPFQSITGQYLNIITKTINASSFRLDGGTVSFTTIASNPQYSYARETVAAGVHRMTSDSNFQVVAYGFGNLESYGYAGGTNIKNLTQSIGASADSACVGDTIRFVAEVNYNPSFKKWYFGDGTWDTTNLNPKHVYANRGEYVVSLVTYKDGLVDCNSVDSTIYRIKVRGYPTANFSITGGPCEYDTFYFSDLSQSNFIEESVTRWEWAFPDGGKETIKNTKKLYQQNRNVNVRFIAWNNGLCPDTLIKTHFISPKPSPAITKNDTCPGYEITFLNQSSIIAGRISSAQWLIDSIQSDTGNTVRFSSLQEGMHFIDLRVISDSGCIADLRDSFRVYQLPKAKFSTSNHCYNTSIAVFDSSLRAVNRFWNYGDTAFSGPPASYVYSDTGDYRITLKVQSAEGCFDSVSGQVTVYPLPIADWKSVGVCFKDEYRFEPNFDSALYNPNDFTWNISGINRTGPTQFVNFFSSGSKNITLTTKSQFGCVNTALKSLFVNPHPSSTVIKNDTCPGYEIQFRSISSVNPGGISSLDWLFDGVQADTGSVVRFVSMQEGVHRFMLQIKSDSGCQTVVNDSFTIYPLPRPDFQVSNHCFGTPLNIINTTTGAIEFMWDYRDTAFSGSAIPFNLRDTGNYTIRLKAKSNKGCLDSAEKPLTVYPLPLATWISSGNCSTEVFQFQTDFDSMAYPLGNYNWTIDGVNYIGPSQSRLFPTSGSKNVSLRVESIEGCINTFTSTVFVNPLPISIPVYVTACEGHPGMFIDQSNYRGSSSFFREWIYGPITKSDSLWSMVPNSSYPPNATLRIRTDSFCEATASVAISAYALPVANFSTVGECPKSPIINTDQSIVVPGDPLVDWIWTAQGVGAGSGNNSFSWTPDLGGDYRVTQVIVSSLGCKDTTSKFVHVLDVPKIQVDEFPACVNLLAELEDRSSSIEHTITAWNWKWNGSNFSGKRVGAIFPVAGYYRYSLDLTTSAGCRFDTIYEDSILISDKPVVNFTVDKHFALLDNANFIFNNQTADARMNWWSFGDGNTSTARSPRHTYIDTGLYYVQLTVENSKGCQDSAWDTLRVRPMLECFVPNAITPNYDRINDDFAPVCEGLESFDMRIYNRWGQLVFETQASEPWDPYKNSNDNFQSGMYMYVIIARDYLGNPKFFSGSFILIQ